MGRAGASALILLLGLGSTACMEQAQLTGEAGPRKADVAAWQGAGDSHSDAGWKAGDAASWEQHLKRRAQGQNEYSRTATP
jgi:hypothetical protein